MKYYDIKDDLASYPDAWCYLVWSARGPGKTYSSLRYMVENGKTFVFLKRTIEDVKLLCANGDRHGVEFDISPFVPLNRDFGWSIKPVQIVKGIAGFYQCNEDGDPVGKPIGYCSALSASKDIKGFDMSVADFLIFDEFIPKKHERINRNEGEQLLDIYMTIRRDRLRRGREDLKMICIANATNVNNPVFQVLDVVDKAVQMDVTTTEFVYIEDRGIMMHQIPAQDDPASGIESAMAGTEWAEMAFGGHFAYDDFSAVRHQRLKGYKPQCCCIYKRKPIYVYYKEGGYFYLTSARAEVKDVYDLSKENDQRRFFLEYIRPLRESAIQGACMFEEYTMYDLIFNFKKIFSI